MWSMSKENYYIWKSATRNGGTNNRKELAGMVGQTNDNWLPLEYQNNGRVLPRMVGQTNDGQLLLEYQKGLK